MKDMKTKYSNPTVNIIKIAPIVLQSTSIDTRSYREGNAQSIAASRRGNNLWDEEEEEE